MKQTGKKRKTGLKLTLLGLILGASIGLGILAVESFIAGQLEELLTEEARKACDCSFAADRIEISLLRFAGKARNARILKDGEPRLIFKRVDARFSLSRISERLIVLKELHLQNGVAYNVNEDSATFQFIDSISTAPPPGTVSEDRWKLHLERLKLSASRFTQDYPGTYISGSHISMDMMRTSEDTFDLLPRIGDLRLTLKRTTTRSYERTIHLGKVSGKVTIEDARALFKKVQLVEGKTRVLVNAVSDTDNDNALTGTSEYKVDTHLLQIGEFLRTTVLGTGTMSGTLGNPATQGTIEFNKDKPVPFTIEGLPLFYLDALTGSFSYDLNHGAHQLLVPDLSASGPQTSVRLVRPLRIDDADLSAEFSLSVGSFEYEGIRIEEITASAVLGDTLESPSFAVTGTAGRTILADYYLPSIQFEIKNKPLLTFSLSHDSATSGHISARGTIATAEKAPMLESGSITLRDFSVFQRLDPQEAADPFTLKRILVSGTTTLSGPLSLYDLSGSGTISVASRHFAGEAALQGAVTIENGTFNSHVFNGSKSIDARLNLDFINNSGSARLDLQRFRPAEYHPDASCIQVSTRGTYDFSLTAPKQGSGSISLSGLTLGCLPYAVELQKPAEIPIENGTATLSSIVLSSATTDFSVSGTAAIEKLNISAQGTLLLNSLLGFIPALDDLGGQVDATISITGSAADPVVHGHATIRDGQFASEASDLIADRLHGALSLDGDIIAIEYLNGRLNGGSISVSGTADMGNFSESSATILIDAMSINAIPDVSAVASASLEILRGEQHPSIEGTIYIDSVEFRKELNLSALVESVLQLPAATETQPPILRLPRFDLDLRVEAPRNIFMYSNFLTAEFNADLHVTGTLNSPQVDGELTSLGGWLGLKNRRFDITSGVISFADQPLNPEIEIIGETSVFGKTGNFVSIILEATGRLDSPQIELTSDAGLIQSEILEMLTSDVREVERTRANSFLDSTERNGLALIEQRPGSAVRNMLHQIASIDELAVEPALNNRTGAVEPSLTATKWITDELAIIGNTFLGPEPSSRLRLRYDLTPYLNIAGTFDSINVQENASVGVDLTYTVFARKIPFIDYSLAGNDSFDRFDLLQGVRLNSDSRIRPDELARVTRDIEQFYRDNGFLHVLAVVSCKPQNRFCRELFITVFEGPRSQVVRRELTGDPLPPEVERGRLPSIGKRPVASKWLRTYQQQVLTERLRAEGYLSSRVNASYREIGEHEVVLILDVSVGSQDSFIFYGNTAFSPEEFLQTINIFNRKQPFGRNTIKILIENMERMYREEGYLFASINYDQEVQPESRKTVYKIHIREEVKVSVDSVTIAGNETLPEDRLRELFRKHLPGQYESVFEPEALVAERLEQACALMEAAYQLEGYPDARVSYTVHQRVADENIDITYQVTEGPQLLFSHITLRNLPASVEEPLYPEATISVPRVNEYITSLQLALENAGYRQATLETERSEDHLAVHVSPGSRTIIDSITIEGLVEVPEKVILDALTVSSEDPWVRSAVHESRRHLLLLGLFSRVEILAADGTVDEPRETMLVRVVERALTTLEIGGGLNSELGIHAFGEAIDKSIFLDGSSIGVRSDIYIDQRDGEINQGVGGFRYVRPNVLGSQYQLTEDARFQKTDLNTFEYDLERYILDSSLYRRFTDDLTANFSHSLFQDSITSVPDDARLSELDSGIVNLSMIGATLRWDKKDSPVLPTRGYSFVLDPRMTAEWLGSDANFYSLSARSTFLYPIFASRFSIAEHLRVASSWTFDETPDIPITQRYYLGGRQTIRGFRENSLGPRGNEGSVIGGDVLVQNNFELRYRARETISTHIFFDAGNVFLRDRSIDLADLRTSIGIGARYLSPIGPIGLDLGHPLDEQDGEPSVRLHFNIGTTF